MYKKKDVYSTWPCNTLHSKATAMAAKRDAAIRPSLDRASTVQTLSKTHILDTSVCFSFIFFSRWFSSSSDLSGYVIMTYPDHLRAKLGLCESYFGDLSEPLGCLIHMGLKPHQIGLQKIKGSTKTISVDCCTVSILFKTTSMETCPSRFCSWKPKIHS